jgi:CDP-6-deoxy-D-xylo-4-hexulose-3-dehydrase
MNEDIVWPLMSNNISRFDLDNLIEYLKQENPRLTHGPKVIEFEELWSNWLGVSNSCMVNSGSSANDITMMALKEMYGEGEVIVPALTWVSDIASVLNAGLRPVVVDINRRSLGAEKSAVLRAISKDTRAVFLTHILGFDALDDEVIEELRVRNIPLIEDVCESHGAMHKNRKLGAIGYASNFSFYYAHHMSTIEGGMISSNDEEFVDICRMMRSHGLVRESRNAAKRKVIIENHPDLNPEFVFQYASHNMRPTEINGVLGINQLKRLDENVKKRNHNFEAFLEVLDPELFQTEFQVEGMSNYALTLILKKSDFSLRDAIESRFKKSRIEFRRGLSGGGNQLRQPYFIQRVGSLDLKNFPNVEHVHNFGWYLGNYPDMPRSNLSLLSDVLNGLI